MGDPRKLKNKYEKPKRLWDEERITAEKALKREYGLKNMRELWVMNQELKRVRREARRLLSLPEEQQLRDMKKVVGKLNRLGILSESAKLDDILSLEVRDVLERRLQTLVKKKGLAKTMKQARQLIKHGFVEVNGRRVPVPSYLVTVDEEKTVKYKKPINLEPKAIGKVEESEKSTSPEETPATKPEPKEVPA
ncbi:30S ribosomal protein S4 [Candidatus Micrarchaeota archaeon]|nr:30S ribosomal protein S4 [Candidatus Micrarchaeota archaeon]